MSPCFGRMDTSSEATEAMDDDGPARKGSLPGLPRRSTAVDRLSRKASLAGHNEAMANRYFSGFNFGSQVQLAGITQAPGKSKLDDDNAFKMQTYSMSGNEWDAFHGLSAPQPSHAMEHGLHGAPSPALIIQRPHDDPPAYGEADGVDGHQAHEVRHIV